jgi:general secretion pathway protein A
MFAILSCLTCILFLVILAATSRNKRPVAGSPRSPRAKVAQGVSRAVSHSDSAGTLPRISSGLDSKAVMKVASSGARRETPLPSSPVALRPLGDRKAQPMMSLPAGVLSAVSEKTDGSTASSPDSTASAIAAVPVGAGSSKTSDENISQYRAASSEDASQEEVKAPLPVQEASAVAASAPAVVERAEVAQTAPVAASGDNSADCGPVVALVEDPSAAVGTAITSVAKRPATAAAQAPVENPAEGGRSRGSRVAASDEEVRAPSLLAFYGLKQQPFDVTPDPAYLYRSRVHREAFHAISQGVENLRGFVALVAEPGMGKTTLLNKLMEELNGSARVVFLCQTQCDSSELLRHLLTELGVEHEGGDRVAMHKVLNQALFEEMLQGRRFVLIVDEAQNLQDSVLETIRMLSNYETTHSKMIQIVLAGQPQLVETLMRPSLVQLRQRIAVLANLEPLDAAETAEYIEHRLRAAGSGDVPIFTAEAMTLIAERSQGIPRSINNICFNAMLAGYMNRLFDD